MHVHGYGEKGSIDTPLGLTIQNQVDRFSLAIDVIDRVPGLGDRCAHVKQDMRDMLVEHHEYVCEHGDDLPAVRDWTWPYKRP